jgi:hypothetical protein
MTKGSAKNASGTPTKNACVRPVDDASAAWHVFRRGLSQAIASGRPFGDRKKMHEKTSAMRTIRSDRVGNNARTTLVLACRFPWSPTGRPEATTWIKPRRKTCDAAMTTSTACTDAFFVGYCHV